MKFRAFPLIVTVAAAAALSLTACTANAPAATESIELYGHTVTTDEALAAAVPADWKSGITVPIQVLRPNAFVDEDGKTVGMQPDLIAALAVKLGIPITTEVTSFDAQVPGVQANRYAFTTATGDFEKRREIMNMTDYTLAGLGWMVRNESDIQSKDDVCGHSIGVAKGTNQEVMAEEFVADCEAQGIEGTSIVGIANTIMTVPLEAKQVDVIYDSISSVLYFQEHQGDSFRMVGAAEYDAAIAFGVNKADTAKAELLQKATQALVDEGVYASIFEHWGLADLQLQQIHLNSEGLDLEHYIEGAKN